MFDFSVDKIDVLSLLYAMDIKIIGDVDTEQLFCAGSLTKCFTTFVILSFLAEKYSLANIIDDDHFLNALPHNQTSKEFLLLFQKIIGNQFTIRDLCSFYSGLPYTFDVSMNEIIKVEHQQPFKHHSIFDETTFLNYCQHHITPIYTNRCKFHYSELSIIFLAYLIEKVFNLEIENLYNNYLLKPARVENSIFSREMPPSVLCQDLSGRYDYPAIAILSHGYFSYSNGFYTTLNDMRLLLEYMLNHPVFHHMTNLSTARAASNTLLNGMTVEIRSINDDIIYGYEGLSFSGCNIWAYSTKYKQGYLTFTNNEEIAYDIIYGIWGYTNFDPVPTQSQIVYRNFLAQYQPSYADHAIPIEFRGHYHRVRINDYELKTLFSVEKHYIIIRNPDEVQYDVIFLNGHYHIKGKDNVHGTKVGFVQSIQGKQYMYFDGTLYVKVSEV